MLENEEDDEYDELSGAISTEIVPDQVIGSGYELEKLLAKGKIKEFFEALGVDRGFPDSDELVALKETCNMTKGNILNIFCNV